MISTRVSHCSYALLSWCWLSDTQGKNPLHSSNVQVPGGKICESLLQVHFGHFLACFIHNPVSFKDACEKSNHPVQQLIIAFKQQSLCLSHVLTASIDLYDFVHFIHAVDLLRIGCFGNCFSRIETARVNLQWLDWLRPILVNTTWSKERATLAHISLAGNDYGYENLRHVRLDLLFRTTAEVTFNGCFLTRKSFPKYVKLHSPWFSTGDSRVGSHIRKGYKQESGEVIMI